MGVGKREEATRSEVFDGEADGLAAFTLQVKQAVDGLRVGLHRSRHRGHSAVFLDHREYRPGDDPRLLDWRAFARTDRPSIKRFEQESEARVTLVLDRSASMDWAGFDGEREAAFAENNAENKLTHAKRLLGALAWIFLDQGDRVGCAALAEELATLTPMEGGRAQRDRVLDSLFSCASTVPSDLAQLRSLIERSPRRQIVVIASDLLEPTLDDGERLAGSLKGLRARGHEVIVLHVMHDDELALPAIGAARFVGLQGEADVEAEVAKVRARYAEEVERFRAQRRDVCVTAGARYVFAQTSVPIAETLAEIASQRGR